MKSETASGKLTISSVEIETSLEFAENAASSFEKNSRAKNTIRSYRSSWNDFERWCQLKGLTPLPATPNTVRLYISDKAGVLKVGTLGLRLASIAVIHNKAGYPNPASRREEPLKSVWAGIRREKGSRRTQKAPILRKHIRMIVDQLSDSRASEAAELRRLRDRALLLIGFGGALRRSEIAALQIGDLEYDDRGVLLHIRSSKTDVYGEGEQIGIPSTGTAYCPVRALKEWTEFAKIKDGNVFRAIRHGPIVTGSLSTKTIANLIKKHAGEAEMDAELVSGHSLRAGMITQAAQSGAREVDIMRHSRHKSIPVLREYVRKATVWQDNAAVKALG
jgi:integrase